MIIVFNGAYVGYSRNCSDAGRNIVQRHCSAVNTVRTCSRFCHNISKLNSEGEFRGVEGRERQKCPWVSGHDNATFVVIEQGCSWQRSHSLILHSGGGWMQNELGALTVRCWQGKTKVTGKNFGPVTLSPPQIYTDSDHVVLWNALFNKYQSNRHIE
jgi:hypothetical protein